MQKTVGSLNSFLKLGVAGVISVIVAGCATSSNQVNTDKITKKFTNGELTIDNISSSTLPRNFPKLAENSLDAFKSLFPIKIVEDSKLDDGAKAARIYTKYEKTDECVILTNIQNNNALEGADLSYKEIETFIYLHELAHCADAELAPKGVNKDEWLEALADGYAIKIMRNEKAISEDQISKLTKYRKRNGNLGAFKMDQYLANSGNNSQDIKSVSEKETLEEVREIRRKIFR